jgi:hypothetical protein
MRKQERSPIELRLKILSPVEFLIAVEISPPLAGRDGNARGFARLRRFWIKQVVDLFQNPPTQLQQFFPDAALLLRPEANLSRARYNPTPLQWT